jgi:alpha-N-acetylglucosamine transferase
MFVFLFIYIFRSKIYNVLYGNESSTVDSVVAPVEFDPISLNNKVHVESAPIKKRIAYAITVTKDGPFLDGALVLGHSAKKVHDPSKGYVSKYDADLVAFVAPGVVKAKEILEANGWRVLERRVPVEIDEIVNRKYAELMRNSGCCGADEFLKLWAYTLTEYHRVVHLDMDSIIFNNMVILWISFHIRLLRFLSVMTDALHYM